MKTNLNTSWTYLIIPTCDFFGLYAELKFESKFPTNYHFNNWTNFARTFIKVMSYEGSYPCTNIFITDKAEKETNRKEVRKRERKREIEWKRERETERQRERERERDREREREERE